VGGVYLQQLAMALARREADTGMKLRNEQPGVQSGAAKPMPDADLRKKWLTLLRKWRGRSSSAENVALLNYVIDAARSGPIGEFRVGLMDDIVSHLDAGSLEGGEKRRKLRKLGDWMLAHQSRLPDLRPLGKNTDLPEVQKMLRAARGRSLDLDSLYQAYCRKFGKTKARTFVRRLGKWVRNGKIGRSKEGVYTPPGEGTYTRPSQLAVEALKIGGGMALRALSAAIGGGRTQAAMYSLVAGLREKKICAPPVSGRRGWDDWVELSADGPETLLDLRGSILLAPDLAPAVEGVRLLRPERALDIAEVEDATVLLASIKDPLQYDVARDAMAKRSGLAGGVIDLMVRFVRAALDQKGTAEHLMSREASLSSPAADSLRSKVGWIVVHRRWFSSASGLRPDEYYPFAWFVLEATHQPCKRYIPLEDARKGVWVDLKRGQLAASVRYIAGAWGWHPSKVWRFLERLKGSKTETRVETASETAAKRGRNKEENESNQSNEREGRPSAAPAPSRGPLDKKKAKRTAGKEGRLRVPSDWKPSDGDIAYARNQRPELDITRVAEKFRIGGRYDPKVGISPAWQLWVLNEQDRTPRPNGGSASFTPRARPPVATEDPNLTDAEWREALDEWRVRQKWKPAWGPDPSQRGCFASKDLTDEIGIPRPAFAADTF
jgi:hypothetical protein